MDSRALVFDDDSHFGSLILEVFQMLGIGAKYFPSGAGALERIRSEKPSVVVVDIQMPELDGLSICELVRADPGTAHTRVVVVSGSGFPDARARAEWARADLFLDKPFDVAQFHADLTELLAEPTPSLPGTAA
ncbi:MAG: response regulator [Elusimicrobia bacterium]|nr:response regulator [Elusimicrobiota bacterium]